jgi:hypothetical protein
MLANNIFLQTYNLLDMSNHNVYFFSDQRFQYNPSHKSPIDHNKQ